MPHEKRKLLSYFVLCNNSVTGVRTRSLHTYQERSTFVSTQQMDPPNFVHVCSLTSCSQYL